MSNQKKIFGIFIVVVLGGFAILTFGGAFLFAFVDMYSSTQMYKDPTKTCEYTQNGYTIKARYNTKEATNEVRILKNNQEVFSTGNLSSVDMGTLDGLSTDHFNGAFDDTTVNLCHQEIKSDGHRVEIAGSFLSTDDGNSFVNLLPPTDRETGEKVAALVGIPKGSDPSYEVYLIAQSARFEGDTQIINYDAGRVYSKDPQKSVTLSRDIHTKEFSLVSVKVL